MRGRVRDFWLAGVVVTLLIAAVASFYASAAPDGLEWTAGDAGFADTARDSATAGSPLADYAVAGVADGRLSGGLAGVLGVLVVLAVAGGLTLLVRRRRPGESGGLSRAKADESLPAGAPD